MMHVNAQDQDMCTDLQTSKNEAKRGPWERSIPPKDDNCDHLSRQRMDRAARDASRSCSARRHRVLL